MARIGTRVTRIKNADLYAGLMSDMPTDSFECELGLRPGSSSARVPIAVVRGGGVRAGLLSIGALGQGASLQRRVCV